MKQTSKVVIGLAIVVLLIIVGGAWLLYSNLETLVARAIVVQGSKATETAVKVDSVSIDLPAGTAGISSLTIGNPEGFSDRPAISLEDFAIALDPLEVTSDPLVISRVSVDGAHVLIEQSGTKNNLKTILSSVQRLAADEEQAAESKQRKLVIERFELTGTSAELAIPELNESRSVEMPSMVLTDIGRATNGATAAAIAEQILGPIIRQALKSSASGQIREQLEDTVKEKLGDKSDVAEGLLDRLGNKDDDEDDQN